MALPPGSKFHLPVFKGYYFQKSPKKLKINDLERAKPQTWAKDYLGSSYRRNALGMTGLNADWLRAHEEYLRLGRDEAERRVAYRQLLQTAISINDLSEIRECTHNGWALGGDRFREQIEVLGKRRATSKGMDRPRNKRNRV